MFEYQEPEKTQPGPFQFQRGAATPIRTGKAVDSLHSQNSELRRNVAYLESEMKRHRRIRTID